MSFLHPQYLYYLVIPLLFILYVIFQKKELQTEFFSQEVMDKLRIGTNTLTLKKRNYLFFLIAVLLIVAIANPVIKDGKVEVKSKSADIIIALDISDSMLAEDVYPNRLKQAKAKAMELLDLAPTERIGIVAFAKNSYLVSPMSFDHGAVGFLLAKLNTDSITEKGTNFLSLLNVVDSTIQKKSQKHLLILSDGGDSSDFSEEIEYAKEKNITVYILGIGTSKGAPIKKSDGSFIKYKGEIIVSKLNEDISSFATSTGGVYIQSVKSHKDVRAMLREIENASEQKELKSEIIEKYIPLFYYPVGLALFLFLLATSSMRKNTPSLFILFALSFSYSDSYAGFLDFMDLKEAKVAYENEEYEKSYDLYTNYVKDTNNSAAQYNKANTLYKQNKYDEAMQAYQEVNFDDNISASQVQANIGNTFVKQAKEKALTNAVQAYEKSLELYEDKEVRENLEAVKKEIKKQEEKKKEKQEDKKEQDKEDKEKQENKDDKQKSDNDKKSEDNKDSSEDKKSQEDDKKKDSKDKEPDEKKNDEEKTDEDKKKKEQEKKKDGLEKLNPEKKDKEKDSKLSNQAKPEQMSDAEEQKWLDKLNNQQNTYMYMLNNDNKQEENTDAKPW